MPAKKSPTSRQTKRTPPRRSAPSASRLSRFLKACLASAVATFGVASCTLHSGWPEALSLPDLTPILAELGLPSPTPSAPAPVASGQQVQTRFADCPQFFPDRRPPAVPAVPLLRELCFSSFAILHSGQTRTPVLVAQRLNRTALAQGQGLSRTDRFYAEARLPRAERAELTDYRGSGYSRGHLAPAGDMDTPDAMAQSFSLANMVPQDQTHNGGAWSRIEQDTRKYVMRAEGDVFVFTGPVFGAAPPRIGTNQVAVPSHLFKVVYDATTGRSWVHWQANHPDTKAGPPITYDEFVRRTGLRLLPAG